MLVSVVIVVFAVASGMLVGGRDDATRAATGLVSGMRFAALGLVIIAGQLDGRASVLGPAIVYALIDIVVAIAIAALAMARDGVGERIGLPSRSVARSRRSGGVVHSLEGSEQRLAVLALHNSSASPRHARIKPSSRRAPCARSAHQRHADDLGQFLAPRRGLLATRRRQDRSRTLASIALRGGEPAESPAPSLEART